MGLKMKPFIKIDAVPTIFKSGPLKTKIQRLEEDSTHEVTQAEKTSLQRGAYRKREAARVCFDKTESNLLL